jgi:hypothetical protein
MSEQPRSRRQTRAAILGQPLQPSGMFRPTRAKAVRLSEAGLPRILFDLKAEGLIKEVRRAAPDFGGPTALVSLNHSVALGAIELAGQRLSMGGSSTSGELHYTGRLVLPRPETQIPTWESSTCRPRPVAQQCQRIAKHAANRFGRLRPLGGLKLGPNAALAFAGCCLACRGGMPAEATEAA